MYFFLQVCGDLEEDAVEDIIQNKAFRAGIERLSSKYEEVKKQK